METEIDLRTYRRWYRDGEAQEDQCPLAVRPAPANKLTEEERLAILDVCNAPEYTSLPPTQIVPTLLDKGIYLGSESTFYRILRKEGQVEQRTLMREQCFNQALVLHSDNGSAMKSSTMKAKMEELGVTPSYSRPRVSDDNPYVESLFRTLKYAPSWPSKGFASLEEIRAWVDRFVEWYNNEHKHRGLNYVTPSERHAGKDSEILQKRAAVLEVRREQNPER